MFEKIKNIKVRGRCFGEEGKTLTIFPKESNRISVVYGKNGSGKSTVSKAFKLYSDYDVSSELELSLLDYKNNVIKQKAIETKHALRERIYVFDEGFISNNVGLKDNGLESIILFGKQNEVDTEIDNRRKELDKVNINKDVLQDSVDACDEECKGAYKEIIKQLKKHWAEVDSNLRNNKTKSSVNEATINDIYSYKTDKTLSELQKSFDDLYLKYKKLTIEKKDYPEIFNVKPYTEENEKQLFLCLSKQLKQLVVADEDKLILERLKNNLTHAKDLKSLLIQETVICPYCYQTINNEYKETLLNVIDCILNKDVDILLNELSKMRINKYLFDTTPYETLDDKLCLEINNQQVIVNQIIEKYNSYIDEKQNAVYTPFKKESLFLFKEVNLLYEHIKRLQDTLDAYNKSLSDIDKIKNRLLDLNKMIAYKNLEQKFIIYYDAKQKYEDEQKRLSICEKCIVEIERRIDTLESQKKDVLVSVDYINEALEYVFFAKNRMKIEAKDGHYIIKSKGVDVKPISVSCGERNIIALCYFFSKIMEGLDEDKRYSRESLIILDDPISSFDYDNRIGIISYLKQQTSNILQGNSNSRILFFSHDIYTIDSIIKFIDEICNQFAERITNTPKKESFRFIGIFNDLNIEEEKVDIMKNIYSKLLKSVYEFASGIEIEKYEFNVGNMMRRLLEAFGTFEYQKGIVELSTSDALLSKIPKEKRQFFENLMYRLILHEESHSSDHMKTTDVDFYIVNSLEEKKKTARYVLCYMYALNQTHIEMRFKELYKETNNDVMIDIKQWYDEISML